MIGAVVVGLGVAAQVMTNYVASRPPAWLADPVRGWLVLLVLVLLLVVFGLVTGGHGAPRELRGIHPQFGEVAGSLRPPSVDVAVRGRDAELGLLHQIIKTPTEQYAVVCGQGGVGKTTLAAAAAVRARRSGFAVFWIHYRTASDLAGKVTEVAVAMGLSPGRVVAAQRSGASLSDLAWGHLDRVRRWVLIVDDLDQPVETASEGEQLHDYRGWIRPSRGGLLMVTSRDRHGDTWGSAARLVDIGPLSSRAGGQLLCDIAPKAGPIGDAEALAVRLGGLPLALRAAGTLIKERTSPYPTFLAYRTALDNRTASILPQRPDVAHSAVVRTLIGYTWELSLNQLTAMSIPHARSVLHLLALFADAPIPRTLLTPHLLEATTTKLGTAPAIDAALAGLDRYGLIEAPDLKATFGIPTVVLHPVVREATIELLARTADLAPWRQDIDRALIDYVLETVQAGRSGWNTARLLTPHIAVLAGLCGTGQEFLIACGAVNTLANTVSNAGLHRHELMLRQAVLDAMEALLGFEHPDALQARNAFAWALFELGQYERAAGQFRQVLAIQERALGPEHPDVLKTRDRQGAPLFALGHYEKAGQLYKQAMEVRARILGAEHPDTLQSCNNLAGALWFQGQYEQAADLLQQTFAVRERVLGPEHADTLQSRNNLGLAMYHLGYYGRAVEIHEEILRTRIRVLGPEHPRTLNSRNGLGLALIGVRRHVESVELLKKTLVIAEQALGSDHQYTRESRHHLALAFAGLGRHEQAIELFRQTLSANEHLLGVDHPITMQSRHDLAAELAVSGQYSSALPLHRQNFSARQRVLGVDHPDTLLSREGLHSVQQGALQMRKRSWRYLRAPKSATGN